MKTQIPIPSEQARQRATTAPKPANDPSRHAGDIALVERIQRRDETAMREVYDSLSGPMTSFARSCLGNPEDAADIVHEALLVLWDRPERYEGRSSLKSWLFSITRFKSIDRNRKGARTVYSDVEPVIEDAGPSAHDALELTQDAQAVRAAIAELGDVHRRTVHLAFFEHLPYREIARIENVPVGTVKTRILHAKRKLLHTLSRKAL